MRAMLRIAIPVEAGNKAVKEDLIGKLVQQTVELIKPEAAYFLPENGIRTCYFFFDLTNETPMPVIGEPWFMGVNAKVEILPVMNGDELKSGLARLKK